MPGEADSEAAADDVGSNRISEQLGYEPNGHLVGHAPEPAGVGSLLAAHP